MDVLRKLRTVGNSIRKGWHSTDPDSYSFYKRGREHERKQEERRREDADRSAELGRELGREEARRGREYVERYEAERSAAEKEEE